MLKVLLVVVIGIVYTIFNVGFSDSIDGKKSQTQLSGFTEKVVPVTGFSAADQAIQQASDSHTAHVQVQSTGQIIKLLSDDSDGARHQRFIIRLNNGLTLLIAHDIDIAPKIPNLTVGDMIAFNGQYEWNDKGGVVHWTHHDPQGRHIAGWLNYQGHQYQ
ncbi:MAG TPA: DUF3465 domain-containing protein [Methyloradius sp.]